MSVMQTACSNLCSFAVCLSIVLLLVLVLLIHKTTVLLLVLLPVLCTGQIQRMDSLFEAHFSPLASSGKPLGRCGKCGRFMKFMPLRPTRLYCPTCEDILNLPQNGAIKVSAQRPPVPVVLLHGGRLPPCLHDAVQ